MPGFDGPDSSLTINATHDARRKSFVESANGHPDFPIQNLPLCECSARTETAARRRRHRRARSSISRRHASRGCSRARPERAAQRRGRARCSMRCSRWVRGRVRALRAHLSDLLDAEGSERRKIEGMRGSLLHNGRRLRRCTCRRGSAISPTFSPASTTPPMPGGCCGPTIRCWRTTSTCPSPITAAHPRSAVSGHAGARGRTASASHGQRPRRTSGPAAISTMSSSSGSGSGQATNSVRRSRRRRTDAHRRLLPAQRLVGARHPGVGDATARSVSGRRILPPTVSPWVVTPEALAPFRIAQPPRPETIRSRSTISWTSAIKPRAHSTSIWRP